MQRSQAFAEAARKQRVEDRIFVAVGESKATAGAAGVLESAPLGAAVAVALCDAVAHVGGMVVLAVDPAPPESAAEPPEPHLARAVAALLESLERMGADRHRVTCTVAGGLDSLQPMMPAEGPTKLQPRRPSLLPRHVLVLELSDGSVRHDVAGA